MASSAFRIYDGPLHDGLARSLDPASVHAAALSPQAPPAAGSCAPVDRTPRASLPAALEHAVLEILARAPRSGETIEAAFRSKEAELVELCATLAPAEARGLRERLSRVSPGDGLAERFARLVPERRERVLAFLANAPRRAARVQAR